MTTSPGLQIYLQPHMIYTFDLLTPNLIASCLCPVDHLYRNQFTCLHNIAFTRLVTDERLESPTHNASARQSSLVEA